MVNVTTTELNHSTVRLIVPTAANVDDRAATRGWQHNNNLQTTTKLDSNAGGGQWPQLAPIQRSTGDRAIGINKLVAGKQLSQQNGASTTTT